MEVIIPTKNDHEHLIKIVQLLNEIDEIEIVHIVDNRSKEEITKKIKEICRNNRKCVYHFCGKYGKGNAIKKALKEVKDDAILFLDADIENLKKNMITRLINEFNKGYDLIKADIERVNGQSNSEFIIDDLRNSFPELKIKRPTCGIYCVRRDILKEMELPSSWSIDLSILLQAYIKGFKIGEIKLGKIIDKLRSKKSLLNSKKCLAKELKKWRKFKNGSPLL